MIKLDKIFSTKKSIQAKIFVAFSLVIFLSLAIVTAIIYHDFSNNSIKNEIHYISAGVQHANQSLDMILSEINTISIVVASNEDLIIHSLRSQYDPVSYKGYMEEINANKFLASLISYKFYINRIAVVGLNGKVFYSGTPWVSRKIINKAWVNQILQANGRKVLLKLTAEETGRNPVIVLGRAIIYNQKPIGVVIININYQMIEQAYSINPLRGSYLYVVDPNGKFIFNSNPSVPQQNMKDSKLKQLYQKIVDQHDSGQPYLHFKQYLVIHQLSKTTGWNTIGMIPQYMIMQNSFKMRNHIIMVVVILFLLVLFVSGMVSGQITKNLKRLNQAMRWVEEGNFSMIVQIDSKDEVGQLYQVFQSMVNKLRQSMINLEQREKQKREAELLAIQAQVSPHFLYNTLNTIKFMAGVQQIKNIENVTTSLIELLRAVTQNTKELVLIQEELDYIKSYVNIQKYKYTNLSDIQITLSDPKLLHDHIPKLLLQPVIENAIIHGAVSLNRTVIITIKIQQIGSSIVIEITDNGAGMTEQQIESVLRKRSRTDQHFNSMGIHTVRERIQMLFGEHYGLQIFSQPQFYTTVEIRIPVIALEKGETNDQSITG